jgi:hypothetical protein
MQVITEYVNKKVDEKAKEILPAEYRNINRRHAFSVLCLIQCASIVVFVYFTYQAYTQQITSVFLALDKTSGICKDVAKPITNEFYASHTGFGQELMDTSKMKVSIVYNFLICLLIMMDSLLLYSNCTTN